MNPAASIHVLARLLAPITPAQFFADWWNRQALYIEGDPGKFAGLFSRTAFDRATHTCGALKASFKDPKGWTVDLAIRPDQVGKLFDAGMTICAGVLQGDPALTALTQNLANELPVGGLIYFNCYLSPDGEGFGLHFDDHPVWILQIEGSKRWSFSEIPAIAQPLTNFSFPPGLDAVSTPWGNFTRPLDAALAQRLLTPGDVLYLPAGCWHRAQAEGSSLALTLACVSSTPLDLIQRAVLSQLAIRPALRRRFLVPPPEAAADAQIPPVLECDFEAALAALRELTGALTPGELFREWKALAAANRNAG